LHDQFTEAHSEPLDPDFADEETAAGAEEFAATGAAGFDDNLSFQNYFSDAAQADASDDDFEDGEPATPVTMVDEVDENESSRFEPRVAKSVPEEDENNRHPVEEAISEESEAIDESFLMSSEVDELLAEHTEVVFDDGGSEVEDVETADNDREDASFADLIQAIDQELVYISDPSKSAAKTEKKKRSRNGEIEQGVIEKANRLTDKEKVLIKGIRYYKNQEYSRAIQEFQKVLKEYPDYKEAHSILGNAYFRNQMYNEAAFSYERVKELDPNDITAYENLGVIYANRGDYRQAVSEWKRVLELNPERADVKEKIKKALRMIHT
jgi:tetratricopeptide (TPR) repeat protein